MASVNLALASCDGELCGILGISARACLSTSQKRGYGVGENAEERDERESHEDKRPEAQADPHGSPDAEEGARGDGQPRDDEFKEENRERELL